VEVQVLAQIFHGDAGALNVPAGIAHPPGGVPLEGLILELGLGEPKDKVVFVALVGVLFHALPDAHRQVLLVVVVEHVVFFQLGGVKVYVASGEIGVPRVDELGNDGDIFVNHTRGGLHHVGIFDVELFAVGKKGVGIELGDFQYALVLPLGSGDHLILPGVRVGGQMPHVGDVHNAGHVVALVPQEFF
jgi:hypothetical protein